MEAGGSAPERSAKVAPEFSIVIPTYNRPALLGRCLASIEAQRLDRSAFEVIVVDDGPADDTAAVCETVRRRGVISLTYVRGSRRGPAAARNLGIARARGQVVAFIDDDCEAREDWLERLSLSFREGHVDGVEGKVVRHPMSTPFTHFVENVDGGIYLTANMAYRREALLSVGGFDETYPYAAAEDWDLAFRVLSRGHRIVFSPAAVVVHAPVPIRGRFFLEKVKEVESGIRLYDRYPELWRRTTGRTMRRSLLERIFLRPVVETRKWRRYFLANPRKLPPYLMWQILASGRLVVEYLRLTGSGRLPK